MTCSRASIPLSTQMLRERGGHDGAAEAGAASPHKGSWNALQSRSRGLQAILDAGMAGEIRRPWGELAVAHTFTPSDYDLECRSLPEIYGRVVRLKNRAKIASYDSP